MRLLFRIFALSLLAVVGVNVGFAQTTPPAVVKDSPVSATATPTDLARGAYEAMGGAKWRALKSLMISGSLEVYPPNLTQSIPGKFAIVTAGEKMRLEIQAPPAPSVRIIDDGQQVHSSMSRFPYPSYSRYGLYVLSRYDQTGYKVGEPTVKDKKRRGFSITNPDGYVTNFFVDEKTGRINRYNFLFEGYTVGTEVKKFLTLENGVSVPQQFTQTLELPLGTFFVEFKAKAAKPDIEIAADVFEPAAPPAQ